MLARAKIAGLKMEDPEAEQVASKEVVALHAQEARKKVKRDMKVAAAGLESAEGET